MDVWRPCDAVETAAAWGTAIENRDGPTCLVLTRQAVVHQARDADQLAAIRRGGYVLIDSDGPPEAIVIATGSEVGIAAEAVRSAAAQGAQSAAGLHAEQHDLRAPGRCLQAERAAARRSTRRVAVEAGAREPWWHYVGLKGQIVGIDHFGASAPAKDLFKHYGFTPEHVVAGDRKSAGGSGA